MRASNGRFAKNGNSAIIYDDGLVEISPNNPCGLGQKILCDRDVWERVKHITWAAKRMKHSFYAISTNNSDAGQPRTILLHRLVLQDASKPHIDHKNRNGLDNRRCNLRPCTNSENHMNERKRASSKSYKGVYWNKPWGKWVASICKDGKRIQLGAFDSPIDAALAYDAAALIIFGEFASPNFASSQTLVPHA